MQSKKLTVPGQKTFDLVKGTMREYNKRTKQACDRCRMKKSKCCGGYPCSTCVHRGWTCIYSSRRRSDPIRWHSHMQETIEEALQRLYKLCEGAKIFPGEVPQDNERGITTECILRAMGLTIDSQPDDSNQETPHGLSEIPTDPELPGDAVSIHDTETDAWSHSWSTSDDGTSCSYFEPQTTNTPTTNLDPRPNNAVWDVLRMIQLQESVQLQGYMSSLQPLKSIDPVSYHSELKNGHFVDTDNVFSSVDGQISQDFGEIFGFDQMLLSQS